MRASRTKRLLSISVLIATVALGASPSAAQSDNSTVIGGLAVRCMSNVLEGFSAVVLEPDSGYPYVRSSLVSSWSEQEINTYEPGAEGSAGLPTFRYSIDAAGVTYRKGNEGDIERIVLLSGGYTLVGPDGQILADRRCDEEASDRVMADALDRLETTAFPETVGDRPHGSWVRRYLEPVVIGVAAGLGVYLFFNLRSNSADNG